MFQKSVWKKPILLGAMYILFSHSYGGGIPVIDGTNLSQNMITAIQQVASVLKQIDQYKTQLKQYGLEIKDNKNLTSFQWSQIQQILGELDKASNKLSGYKKELQGIDEYLNKIQTADYYRNTPCFSGSGSCSLEQREAEKKNFDKLQKMQQMANDGLLEVAINQIDSVQKDLNTLNKIKMQSQRSEGVNQSIQNLNQQLELQNSQLIQLRVLISNLNQTIAQNNQKTYSSAARIQAAQEANSKATRLDEVSKKEAKNSNNQANNTNPSSQAAKAAKFATQRAHNKSQGLCAQYVRIGLNRVGIDIGRTYYAKDYGGGLKRAGFKPMNISPSQAKAGDVVIFKAVPGHKAGHMAIYNGSNWVSDFKQKSFYVSKAYMNGKYTIYRKP